MTDLLNKIVSYANFYTKNMYKHSKLYYFDTKMVVINIYRYDDLNMIK